MVANHIRSIKIILNQIKSYGLQILCGVLVVLALVQTFRLHGSQLAVEKVTASWQADAAKADRAAAAQEKKHRETERLYLESISTIDTETSAALARARDDKARAVRASDKLRSDLADYLTLHRQRAQAAATAGQCATDDASRDLLADLLGRADKAAGELAEVADDAIARGRGAERSYDALIR